METNNKKVGIYKIENLKNGMIYIGQSIDIEKRWKQHHKDFKANRHNNKIMQRVYNKYGDKIFSYSIIELCDEKQLNDKEKYWLDFYGGFESKKTYNLKDAGDYQVLSKESREKLSKSNKGKKRTPEQIEKARQRMKGRKLDKQWCENISKSKMGNQLTKGYKKIEKDGKIKKVKPELLQEYLDKGWVLSHKIFNDNYKRVVWNKGTKGVCKANSGSFKKGHQWTEEEKQKSRETRKRNNKPIIRKKYVLSPEMKEKVRKIAREVNLGNTHTKGTVWVNNGKENHRIKPDKLNDYMLNGYIKGKLKGVVA